MTLNSFLRGTAIGSVFALLLVPFIVADNLFFPFITGKNFMFRAIVEVGFAAWLLLALRDSSARPKKSWVMWAFAAFAVAMAVANLAGVNPWKSFWSNFERMEGYVTIIHLFAYFIVATSVLTTERLWNRFLASSVWASVVMSIYGVFQLAGVFVINQGGVRVDGRFGNATYLAIYLVFNIFFALILASRSKQPWAKVGYGAIAALHSVILYYTATRGSMLGLIGGIILTSLVVLVFNRGERRARNIAAGVLGAVVIVVGGFILIRDSEFVAQSPVLNRFASISIDDTKTQARGYIWPMAIQAFKENPILGSGQENFNYTFNENYDPRMYRHEQWFDRAHNVALDWLSAGGILGFAAYISLFVSALWLLWKRSVDMPFIEKALLTGLGAAYFFHNLFVFDNIASYILFASVLAYIHFKSTKLELPIGAKAEEFDSSETRMAGPLILIALVFVLYFVNWRGYATNASLIDGLRAISTTPVQGQVALEAFTKTVGYDTLGRAEVVERLVEAVGPMNGSGVPIETRQKFYELAKGAVDKQIERTPDDARYRVFAGSFYNSYGQPAEAEAHFTEAVNLSPNKQSILYQLGNFYLSSKQYDKAVSIFKRAFELETSNETAARLYVVSLVYAGEEATARAFLLEHFGSDSLTHDMFVQAFAETGNWTRVISILRERIAADPTNLGDLQNLAAAYAQIGDKANAIATVREMIRIEPAFKAQGEQYIQAIQQGR